MIAAKQYFIFHMYFQSIQKQGFIKLQNYHTLAKILLPCSIIKMRYKCAVN